MNAKFVARINRNSLSFYVTVSKNMIDSYVVGRTRSEGKIAIFRTIAGPTFVFDDPIPSLDQNFEKRIAKELAGL